MSWNEPGGNNQPNDPWNKNRDQDLNVAAAKFINKLRSEFGFKKNKNEPSDPGQHYGIILIIIVLAAVWALSGLYIVNPAEKSVNSSWSWAAMKILW